MPVDPNSSIPDQPYVRTMGRIVDRRIAVIDQLRSEAVQRLQLQPGNRVIDAGCGNGASFPYLINQVGPTGEVVGIEISSSMAERARRNIQAKGWMNVEIIEESAETAVLNEEFDALLLFAAHEILTSSRMLDRLFAHLRDGARVAAFGAKLASPPLGWLLNPFFHLVSKKWLPNSTPIDAQPWRLLSERLTQIRVEQRIGGVMYLVSGQK